MWLITFSLISVILIIITISVCNIFNYWNKLRLLINSIVQLDQALDFFTCDILCKKSTFTLYILFVGPFMGCIYFSYFLFFGIPAQEGVIENINSLLLLISSIFLFISTTRITKLNLPGKTRISIALITLFLSTILFLLFGEEISWGQHIFHWKSTGIFNNGYNFQSETNIHNFFNPLFKFVYPLIGIVSFVVIFFIWFFPKKTTNYLFNLFVPHPSLFFLVFLMACASCLAGKETYEELVAVFLLLYSIRVFMCLSFPAKVKETE